MTRNVSDVPPFVAARNPTWFDTQLDERESFLVGEYDGWQGPAAGRARLHPDRRFTDWGIVPIPGRWRLYRDVMSFRLDNGDLLFSRLSHSGHFYGDINLRRIKAFPPPAVKPLEILKVSYGSAERWHDATQVVKAMVQGNRLSLRADNNSLAGGWDPTPGVHKLMRVSYVLDGKQFDEDVRENLIFRIQEDDLTRSYKPVPSIGTAPKVRYRVVSFYMDNTIDVAAVQKRAFDALGVPIDQVLTYHKHGIAVDEYLTKHRGDADYVILMDVDAVPLSRDAIPTILANISGDDRLVGPSAQSNHINHDHPFAGASCLGISMKVWDSMGRPTLRGCQRSDTSEELTWAAEEDGIGVGLLWPGHVEDPIWDLGKGRRIGYGTTYVSAEGTPVVYHAFECRFGYQRFLNKCQEVIDKCS